MDQQYRKQFVGAILLPLLLLVVSHAMAQCPDNIGFEKGTFDNWETFEGNVSKVDGSILTSPNSSLSRFTMFQNTYPQQLDPYGQFPVNCPNGSNYSIMIGNNSTGGHAQTVSYTFTIPANQDNYSIIYNYAVVLQNPAHSLWQQPGFFSRVFDVTANQYIDCGAFNFLATSSLPGFQLSAFSSNVYYKPWSPITVKLVGYAGKTIRLEFTSHDCAPGGHFGYAYLDVNENCSSPLSGNVYCDGSNSLTLTAPFGFSGYNWYNADYSTILGTSNTLRLSPPPAPGTIYHVVVSPYPGLGCLDTLTTAIKVSTNVFKLQTIDTIVGCSSDKIDLTAAYVTAGSSPDLSFSYYTDLSQINYLATPKQVPGAGVYYIKAQNKDGCSDIKPVVVDYSKSQKLVIQDPLPACSPNKVDITAATITAGSDAGLTLSYWKDILASTSLPNPKTIDSTAIYYIKALSSLGCSIIMPVQVTVSTAPVLTTNNITVCGAADITTAATVSVNQADAVLSFWEDKAATISLPLPNNIQTNGTYYVKAANTAGCIVTGAIQVKSFPVPYFSIAAAPTAVLPATIDLTILAKTTTNTVSSFSYWTDSAATTPVLKPAAIALSGMYFIKASTVDGCFVLDSVKLTVNEPPIVPPNIFSPNNDGINDTWEIPLLSFYPHCSVDVYDRSGQIVYHSIGYSKPWDGKINGKTLPIATYYYLIISNNSHAPISGSITIIQ